MGSRMLSCLLTAGAFTLTLVFSYRHYDAAPVTRAAPQPDQGSPVPKDKASNPFGPSSKAPTTSTAAAAPPAPAIAPAEPVQSEPYSTRPVDDGAALVRGDRGAERGSRSR
jgi:hypothetical protein